MNKKIRYRLKISLFAKNDLWILNKLINEDIVQAKGKTNLLLVKAGDSWVPVTCEVDERRSYVMLSKDRRPGFIRNERNSLGKPPGLKKKA